MVVPTQSGSGVQTSGDHCTIERFALSTRTISFSFPKKNVTSPPCTPDPLACVHQRERRDGSVRAANTVSTGDLNWYVDTKSASVGLSELAAGAVASVISKALSNQLNHCSMINFHK